jgi:hypothetical protein
MFISCGFFGLNVNFETFWVVLCLYIGLIHYSVVPFCDAKMFEDFPHVFSHTYPKKKSIPPAIINICLHMLYTTSQIADVARGRRAS